MPVMPCSARRGCSEDVLCVPPDRTTMLVDDVRGNHRSFRKEGGLGEAEELLSPPEAVGRGESEVY